MSVKDFVFNSNDEAQMARRSVKDMRSLEPIKKEFVIESQD
jgi:hypothetical protein